RRESGFLLVEIDDVKFAKFLPTCRRVEGQAEEFEIRSWKCGPASESGQAPVARADIQHHRVEREILQPNDARMHRPIGVIGVSPSECPQPLDDRRLQPSQQFVASWNLVRRYVECRHTAIFRSERHVTGLTSPGTINSA